LHSFQWCILVFALQEDYEIDLSQDKEDYQQPLDR
jgi:hypothetical protein